VSSLARDLFLLGQDRVGAAEVHDDVLALEALDDAREQLTLPILELVENDRALRLADLLDDVLLGGLRRDPPELVLRELREQLVADLGLGIERRLRVLQHDLIRWIGDLVDDGLDLEQLHFSDVGVELGFDLMLEAERTTRRRQHRLFESGDDDALVDALLLADLLDDAIQIGLHVVSFRLSRACAVCRTLGTAAIRPTLPDDGEFVLVVRTRDRVEGDVVGLVIVTRDRDPIGSDRREHPPERVTHADALARLHEHALADERREVSRPRERSVDAR
jgi:hypothetical protein